MHNGPCTVERREDVHVKVGFIGTGSMGSILIEAFIQSGVLESKQVVVTNRTIAKAQRLAEKYPGLHATANVAETTRLSHIVFICVKPLEFKNVVNEIAKVVTPDQLVVSITSPILIEQLESSLSCKVAKIIPSIANYVQSGASICMYGSRIGTEDRLLLEQLMISISQPIVISEQHTRITSDICSCGPAFLALFVQKWIDAAVERTGIDYSEATRLACEMVLGTGKLLTEGKLTPEQLQQRVAVPGGITAEALHLLQHKLDGVFHQLIDVTHGKFQEDLEKVKTSWSET
nr:late competence protein ComER [Paenibacillus arenosi]